MFIIQKKAVSQYNVSIVILNWNGIKHLEQFLPILVNNTLYSKVEIVVADNCSTDESVSFVQKNFPSVRIIKNKENYGFAGGYNEALKQVNTEYYVLLNQDVEVSEGWLTPLMEFMDTHPEVAATQPKIKDFTQRDLFEYAGAAGGYIDLYGYPSCRGRIFETVEKDTGQYNDPQACFWATGACLLIRSEAFWQAKGFDTDFFAHMEEIDLCWRLQLLGHKVYTTPLSEVYHIGGGSLPPGSPRKVYLNFRNSLIMLTKNLPGSIAFTTILARLILDGISAWRALLFNKQPGYFLAVIKAHWNFFLHLPKHLRKRSKNRMPLQKLTGVLPTFTPAHYFLKNRTTFNEIILALKRL